MILSPDDHLSRLPDELLRLLLLAHLDLPDWQLLARVSRRLRALVLDPRLHRARRLLSARSLDRALQRRPTPAELYRRHVLLSPRRLSPAAEPGRTYMLLTIPHRRARDMLARALANRPSPQELRARGLAPSRAAHVARALERQRVEAALATFLRRGSAGSRAEYAPVTLVVVTRRRYSTALPPVDHEPSDPSSSRRRINALLRRDAQEDDAEYFVRQSVRALASMYSFTAAWLASPPPPRAPPLPTRLRAPNSSPSEPEPAPISTAACSVSAIKRKLETLAQSPSCTGSSAGTLPTVPFVERRRRFLRSVSRANDGGRYVYAGSRRGCGTPHGRTAARSRSHSHSRAVSREPPGTPGSPGLSRSSSAASLRSDSSTGTAGSTRGRQPLSRQCTGVAQGAVATLRQHFISLSC